MSDKTYDQFKAFIHHFVSPTEIQLAHFLSLLEVEKYSKNEYLLHAGEVCNKVYFINQGILRHFMSIKA